MAYVCAWAIRDGRRPRGSFTTDDWPEARDKMAELLEAHIPEWSTPETELEYRMHLDLLRRQTSGPIRDTQHIELPFHRLAFMRIGTDRA